MHVVNPPDPQNCQKLTFDPGKSAFRTCSCLLGSTINRLAILTTRFIMHLSGLIILCEPASTGACLRDLEPYANIEVYVTDPALGRVVVVMETETLEGQEDGLRQVQQLPYVKAAELVYHYFGDADNVAPDSPDKPANQRKVQS